MSGRMSIVGYTLEEEIAERAPDFPYTAEEMRKLPVSTILGAYWPRSYVFQTWDYMKAAPKDQYAEDLELYKRILFKEPLEEMPLYLHQQHIERLFAEWRLEIGK